MDVLLQLFKTFQKKRFIFALLKKWRAAKGKKKIPSIYNNTHMQQDMQKKIRKNDEKGKITCN